MNFLPGSIPAQSSSGPVIWLGLNTYGEALVVSDEGRIFFVKLEELNVDWRYDWREQRWVEVTGVTYAAEEFDDDGSEELPGQLLDPDGAGPSDSLDQEGGPPPGNPGNMDSGAEIAGG